MGEIRVEWEEAEQRLLLEIREEQHRARINSKASQQHLACHFGVHSDRCAPLPPLLRLPAEVLCHVLSVYVDAIGLASLFWTCRSFALAVLSADAFQGTTASEEQCLHVARLMNLPIREPSNPHFLYCPLEFPNKRHRPLVPLRSIPIPQWLHTRLRRPSPWPTRPLRLDDVPSVLAWRPLLDTLLALREPPLSQKELAKALKALHICIRDGDDLVVRRHHFEADFVPLQEFLRRSRCRCPSSHGGCCMGKVFSLFRFRTHWFVGHREPCSLSPREIPSEGCMVDHNMRDICAKAASITSMHNNCLCVKVMRPPKGYPLQILLFLLVSIPWTLGEPHAVVYQAVMDVAKV